MKGKPQKKPVNTNRKKLLGYRLNCSGSLAQGATMLQATHQHGSQDSDTAEKSTPLVLDQESASMGAMTTNRGPKAATLNNYPQPWLREFEPLCDDIPDLGRSAI